MRLSLGDFKSEILNNHLIPPQARAEYDSPISLILPLPAPPDSEIILRSRLCALTALYTGFAVFSLHMGFASIPANVTLALFGVGCFLWLAIACSLPRYTVGLHTRVEFNQAFPLFLLMGALGSIVPACILQLLLAGLLQSYVVNEWLNYSALLLGRRALHTNQI